MATEGGGDPQSVTQATAPVLEAALSVENERPTVGVPEGSFSNIGP